MEIIREVLAHYEAYKWSVSIDSKQAPIATILTCSDSRLQLMSLTDTPENDFFVVRNVGNQFITSKGSVDYGVRELKTKCLIILGHSDCGAIKSSLRNYGDVGRCLRRELDTLHLAYVGSSFKKVDEYSAQNLSFQVNDALSEYQDLVDDSSLVIYGVFYDIKNKKLTKITKNGIALRM